MDQLKMHGEVIHKTQLYELRGFLKEKVLQLEVYWSECRKQKNNLYGLFEWENLSKEIQYNFKNIQNFLQFIKNTNNCYLDIQDNSLKISMDVQLPNQKTINIDFGKLVLQEKIDKKQLSSIFVKLNQYQMKGDLSLQNMGQNMGVIIDALNNLDSRLSKYQESRQKVLQKSLTIDKKQLKAIQQEIWKQMDKKLQQRCENIEEMGNKLKLNIEKQLKNLKQQQNMIKESIDRKLMKLQVKEFGVELNIKKQIEELRVNLEREINVKGDQKQQINRLFKQKIKEIGQVGKKVDQIDDRVQSVFQMTNLMRNQGENKNSNGGVEKKKWEKNKNAMKAPVEIFNKKIQRFSVDIDTVKLIQEHKEWSGYYHYCTVDLLGRYPITQKNSFTIQILKINQKRAFKIGIGDSNHFKNSRLDFHIQGPYILYNIDKIESGFPKVEQNKQSMQIQQKKGIGFLQPNMTVKVTINIEKGQIQWIFDGYQKLSLIHPAIKDNKTYRWVPFIGMVYNGDTIRWVE